MSEPRGGKRPGAGRPSKSIELAQNHKQGECPACHKIGRVDELLDHLRASCKFDIKGQPLNEDPDEAHMPFKFDMLFKFDMPFKFDKRF